MPECVSALEKSTPISAHVKVDLELQGCPMNRGSFSTRSRHWSPGGPRRSSPIRSASNARAPATSASWWPTHAVHGAVTAAGCGALCPGYDRGCYGCFGPMESPNMAQLSRWFQRLGMNQADMIRKYRLFYNSAAKFRDSSDAIGKKGISNV